MNSYFSSLVHPQPNPIAISAREAEETAALGLARGVVDEYIQSLSSLKDIDSEKQLPQLLSLRKERNPKILFHGLLNVGIELKFKNQREAAQLLLGRLAQRDIPDKIRRRAEAENNAMLGIGDCAMRAEYLISNIFKDSTALSSFAPMLGGAVAGKFVATVALGRLAGGAVPWLTSRLGSSLVAGTLGYLSDVSTFAALNHALSPSDGSFFNNLIRSGLTIGVLQFAGWAGRGVAGGIRAAPGFPLRRLVSQSSFVLGLAASHKLEQHFGLMPRVEGETFLLDTMFSAMSLGVAAQLSRNAFVESLTRYHAEVGLRAAMHGKVSTPEPLWPNKLSSPATVTAGAGSAAPVYSEALASVIAMGTNSGSSGNSGEPSADQVRPSASGLDSGFPKTDSPQKLGSDKTIVRPGPAEIPPKWSRQTIIGKYQLMETLGEGWTATVHSAMDSDRKQAVAIKILRQEFSMDRAHITRFQREALIMRHIRDRSRPSNIIEITDIGQTVDRRPYIVMEYLKGKSLSQTLKTENRIEIPRLLPIATQVATGLDALHNLGFVHHDLKLGNIFLREDGSVKVLDFGLAKPENYTALEHDGASDVVLGTLDYMSPEQISGDRVDRRGDIYSLGIVLYKLATGQPPFQGDSIWKKHLRKPPPWFHELDPPPPNIPERFEDIVRKCLAKRRELRYLSMRELIADLDELKAHLPSSPDAESGELINW